MKTQLAVAIAALLLSSAARTASAQTLVIDDPLTGSTKGIRHGGTLGASGYRIDSPDDHITYEVPTITEGAAEFNVRGIGATPPAGAVDDAEMFVMYDGAFSPDPEAGYEGFRNNPYKFTVRRRIDMSVVKIVLKNVEPFVEENSATLSWDANANYRFRVEWGQGTARVYRDGTLLKTITPGGTFAPRTHRIRIGSGGAKRGWPGVTTTNLKVWRGGAIAPGTVGTLPSAPGGSPGGGNTGGGNTGGGTTGGGTTGGGNTGGGTTGSGLPGAPTSRGIEGALVSVTGNNNTIVIVNGDGNRADGNGGMNNRGLNNGQPWGNQPWANQPWGPYAAPPPMMPSMMPMGLGQRLLLAILGIVERALVASSSPRPTYLDGPLGGD